MNPDFKLQVLHYDARDVATLREILRCNNGRISAALSISINQLFLSIPKEYRTIFIVEKCEYILAGKPEPKGENLREFTFKKTPKP